MVPMTNRATVLADIDQLYDESIAKHLPGESEAIAPVTYNLARHFVSLLPPDYVDPEVGYDSDGFIHLEWIKSRRIMTLISISPNYEIHFASRKGEERNRGSMPFFQNDRTLSRSILELIDIAS